MKSDFVDQLEALAKSLDLLAEMGVAFLHIDDSEIRIPLVTKRVKILEATSQSLILALKVENGQDCRIGKIFEDAQKIASAFISLAMNVSPNASTISELREHWIHLRHLTNELIASAAEADQGRLHDIVQRTCIYEKEIDNLSLLEFR